MQRAADQASSYATRCDFQLYISTSLRFSPYSSPMPLPIQFRATGRTCFSGREDDWTSWPCVARSYMKVVNLEELGRVAHWPDPAHDSGGGSLWPRVKVQWTDKFAWPKLGRAVQTPLAPCKPGCTEQDILVKPAKKPWHSRNGA